MAAKSVITLNLDQLDTSLSPDLDPEIVSEWTKAIETGSLSVLSPKAIFADITKIENAAKAKWIEDQCHEKGYIAFIDFDDEWQEWIFHSLYKLGSGSIWKKNVAERFKKKRDTERDTEKDLEEEIVTWLKDQGIATQRQVACQAGIADIVTPDAIYEVKLRLSPDNFFKAIGQVLMYRECINPMAKAIVIGKFSEKIQDLIQVAKKIDVEIQFWK